MSQVKEQSIAAGALQGRPEATNKQSQMLAALTKINQHYAMRAQMEWQEAVALVLKCSAGLPVDGVGPCHEWLRDFYMRRIEDAQYAMEATRALGSIEMKISMGLVEKEDIQAAKAA